MIYILLFSEVLVLSVGFARVHSCTHACSYGWWTASPIKGSFSSNTFLAGGANLC